MTKHEEAIYEAEYLKQRQLKENLKGEQMRHTNLRWNDIVSEHGLLQQAVEENGGKVGFLPFKQEEDKYHRYLMFGNNGTMAMAMAGIVVKVGRLKLTDGERNYLNHLTEEEMPGFVIRYWAEMNRFSLSEYIWAECSPLGSGELEKVVGLIKDFVI